MKSRYKFYYGNHSTHLAKSFGFRFEIEQLGGMGVHYGMPWKTWYLIVDFWMWSWCVGFAQMNQPEFTEADKALAEREEKK